MRKVIFSITNEEKQRMQDRSDLQGIPLSELARTKLLEVLEEQHDLKLYEKGIQAHQLRDESISHEDMLDELGL